MISYFFHPSNQSTEEDSTVENRQPSTMSSTHITMQMRHIWYGIDVVGDLRYERQLKSEWNSEKLNLRDFIDIFLSYFE